MHKDHALGFSSMASQHFIFLSDDQADFSTDPLQFLFKSCQSTLIRSMFHVKLQENMSSKQGQVQRDTTHQNKTLTSNMILQLLQGPICPNRVIMSPSVTDGSKFPT